LGKGQFDRAIEKSQKAIKQHSIKQRPEWNKGRRKTAKDIEWLNRREYNPFLWRAWLLMGKSQFQQGNFEEAAATFSYMTRLYQTRPAILGIARAWLAKSYTEMDWLYEAEDIIVKQQRDSMDYRAVTDWDYTYADYYLHSGQYQQAANYLRKVIRHERRRKQKAREWFLYGQLQTILGNQEEAYNAYRHVIRLNPPYELEFNARIAQTEVLPATNPAQKIKKLRRMAASDNNKEYLDQVYYAIGNTYLGQKDTLHAIEAYEKGAELSTRNGIEKGVLLLTLGNVYWQKEKFADAQRCYGEAIGLLDKDRKDYEQLAERSKVLDELVPHTSAVELQDSLQRLARMSEEERNKIIDRLIADLIKKEKEERRAQEKDSDESDSNENF
jgi:tetratricopeptide (TPR) repeat protein